MATNRRFTRSDAWLTLFGAGFLVLAGLLSALAAVAAVHGKRTMIWGDVVHAHPDRIPEIERDLILLDWWYEAEFDYERVAVFAEREIRVEMSGVVVIVIGGLGRGEDDQVFARLQDGFRREGPLLRVVFVIR